MFEFSLKCNLTYGILDKRGLSLAFSFFGIDDEKGYLSWFLNRRIEVGYCFGYAQQTFSYFILNLTRQMFGAEESM